MSADPQVGFNSDELQQLYQQKDYRRLSEEFLRILGHFEATTYVELPPKEQYFVNAFVKVFLYLFTQPDYVLEDQFGRRFIELNLTISNLVAMSSFKTTDAFLEILAVQPNNFIKLLALYSARNTRRFDYRAFFDTEPALASLWYSMFIEAYRSALVDPVAAENLRRHIQYDDDRLSEFYNVPDVIFGATYIDPHQDRFLKQRVNRVLRERISTWESAIQNRPRRNQIAVVSHLWFPGHSVYRILGEYIAALCDDYELTLVQLGQPLREVVDIGPFRRIMYLNIDGNGAMNITPLQRNEFQLIYFPDVGMSHHSIELSNLRLAPIQVCGTGHSVSTWGSKIDYYVTGSDVESPEEAPDRYSERVVLIPGFGLINEPPRYELRHPEKTTSQFVINCPWLAHKVNAGHVALMRELIDSTQKDLLYRIFAGGGLIRKNDYLPFVRILREQLGANHVEVMPALPYDEYMATMEQGDLTMDSHHFASCNVAADSLHLRKPIVAWEGDRWYNRIAPAMLRSMGMEELIAHNADEFRAIVLRLINEDDYRAALTRRIEQADLASTIFSTAGKEGFKRAIHYLIDNHKILQSDEDRSPIVIPA